MATRYLTEMLGEQARAAQASYYGSGQARPRASSADELGANEVTFIESRDTFYLATVTEAGWPYDQHRGGPKGFLRMVAPQVLALADFRGNRQLISTGNVAGSDKVSLLLMDYPQRLRFKIIGHAEVVDARREPALAEQIASGRGRVERVFRLHVIGFDWNCPAYITPRYTAAEVEGALAQLKERIVRLEAELAGLVR